MKNFITIRIYFEQGQKIENQSFWKRIYSSDFSSELMKRIKAFGLHQALHFNVNKGYLNEQKINWGVSEFYLYNHPHVIEIIDSESRIHQFLEEEKKLLAATTVLLVKNEVVFR